jgi:hypothetical protein
MEDFKAIGFLNPLLNGSGLPNNLISLPSNSASGFLVKNFASVFF